MDIKSFMQGPAPEDITLGELARAMMNGPELAAIRRHSSNPNAVRIRILDAEGRPAPDPMTLAEFRRLVAKGELRISIDDGSGGELVDA